jgi:hypothetical protein
VRFTALIGYHGKEFGQPLLVSQICLIDKAKRPSARLAASQFSTFLFITNYLHN